MGSDSEAWASERQQLNDRIRDLRKQLNQDTQAEIVHVQTMQDLESERLGNVNWKEKSAKMSRKKTFSTADLMIFLYVSSSFFLDLSSCP